jgi:acyl-CoA synthetase (AMP-forming)/AMP-acid ligase II
MIWVIALVSVPVFATLLWRSQRLEFKTRQRPDALSIPSLPLFVAAKETATANPDKVAVIDKSKEESFTYRQLLADVSKFKRVLLKQLGLETVADLDEKRVAFLVPNGFDYVVTQWAIWAAGGICVPLCMFECSNKYNN